MIRVNDNLFRGPRPTRAADIPGIKTLLDLESGWYDFFHPTARDQYRAISLTVSKVVKIPLGDILPPSMEALNRCLMAMTAGPFPIYVHCRRGCDRTGFVVAYYRYVVQGWTATEAIAEMRRLGFSRWYWYWVPVLRYALGE